ncbi:MAG: HEPN domain-containing protein [Armatimonadetes bacterium]|nr:HEPN domain-containing protein [Armatimonadota bacterium]
MKEEIKQLGIYRLSRAKESLSETELLLAEGHVLTAVNRLYYACFYAASAILLLKGYSSPKHTGVRSLFHQKLVKPGLISLSAGKLYNRLFDARQKADYADLVKFEAEDVAVWLQEARSLVQEIEVLVNREVNS